MKANRHARSSWLFAAVLASLLTSACSDQRVIPAPTPTPTPRPTAAPLPPAPKPAADWRDAPIAPGDWSWSSEGGQSTARFAGNVLVLRCNRSNATVTIQRAGGNGDGADVPMTISTTTTSRPVAAKSLAGKPPAVAATLGARDSLLDAIAFSRGRFAVNAAGAPPLYVPSWPEVSRVIEDCRQG